jgi:hypothetical protein
MQRVTTNLRDKGDDSKVIWRVKELHNPLAVPLLELCGLYASITTVCQKLSQLWEE